MFGKHSYYIDDRNARPKYLKPGSIIPANWEHMSKALAG